MNKITKRINRINELREIARARAKYKPKSLLLFRIRNLLNFAGA